MDEKQLEDIGLILNIIGKDMRENISNLRKSIGKLLTVAEAAQKLHALDDLEEPWECPTCSPADPTMFNAVRKELYQALIEWEEFKNG